MGGRSDGRGPAPPPSAGSLFRFGSARELAAARGGPVAELHLGRVVGAVGGAVGLADGVTLSDRGRPGRARPAASVGRLRVRAAGDRRFRGPAGAAGAHLSDTGRPAAAHGRPGQPAARTDEPAGRTRAAALFSPLSTTEPATALGISPATASQHASILADAGLTTKERQGGTVAHHLTLLGGVTGATVPGAVVVPAPAVRASKVGLDAAGRWRIEVPGSATRAPSDFLQVSTMSSSPTPHTPPVNRRAPPPPAPP